jgi:hypothetical protein
VRERRAAFFLALTTALAGSPARAQSDAAAPAFRASERAVEYWRAEAAGHLDLPQGAAAALRAGDDPGGLSRCVRLNNYWCVKGAGWNGMIAADAEGHAAFATAVEGAAVAALLLRRYYLEFARRSATAIVSRWAPPRCGGPVAASLGGGGVRLGMAHSRPNLGPDPGLSTRGLGNTLRARFLAARRSGKRLGVRSRVPDAPASLIPAPTIAAGLGEPRIAPSALRLASLGAAPARPAAAAFAPFACALDGPRLRNYAARVVEGLGVSTEDDLGLFEPDGEPTAALARVMENMSAVEIGPLRADPALARAGIETATNAMRAARAAEGAAKTPTPGDPPSAGPATPGAEP